MLPSQPSFEELAVSQRHCEEQSDEAIHPLFCCTMDCFAALAMTVEAVVLISSEFA
jgi:hypothetical protein